MDVNDTVNNATRQVVISGLGQFGLAGKLTGALTSVLWPADNTNQVWDALRGRIEALINQKIAEETYHHVSVRLDGLRRALRDYHADVTDSQDHELCKNQWLDMERSFDEREPWFMDEKYRLLLLPLFAQFANLHLAFLREGWSNLATWQLEPPLLARKRQKLQETIARYTQYARDTIHANLPPWENKRSKWHARNQFLRAMTLDVLDHAHYWPFFDPSNREPHAAPARVIYSDPVGGDALDDILFEENATVVPLTALGASGDTSLWGLDVEYAGGAIKEHQRWHDGNGDPYLHMRVDVQWPDRIITAVGGRTTDYIPKPDGTWDEWKTRDGVTGLEVTVGGTAMPLFVARPDTHLFRSDNNGFHFAYADHVLASVHCVAGREGTFLFGFRLRGAYP